MATIEKLQEAINESNSLPVFEMWLGERRFEIFYDGRVKGLAPDEPCIIFNRLNDLPRKLVAMIPKEG